jgi:hypothetical protein
MVNKNSGKCLTAPNNQLDARFYQDWCNKPQFQSFDIQQDVPGGYVRIKRNGLCLGVADRFTGDTNVAVINQYYCVTDPVGVASQLWGMPRADTWE